MTDLEYTPRPYADIVRDLLTTLTGGTVREPTIAPATGPLRLDRLASRPIRRVSHLEGVTEVDGMPVAVQFGNADFDLADIDNDGLADAVVFRDNGRKPIAGSQLTVNYYPVQVPRPVPLTDLNVGSVVRTVLETVAREVAQDEQYLDKIYRSAFMETAEGAALDKVVALIGVTRLPPRHPLVDVRFGRSAATGGKITIPAGTVVTDAGTPPARYSTVTELTLEAGEQSRSVLTAGVSADTPVVDAGKLDRLETSIGGISEVSNPDAAFRESAAEADDALRRRARGALHGTVRGTLDALRFGILSVPGVKAVELTEWPDGQAGVVRADVAYVRPDPAVEKAVLERIDELRPAGIRVDTGAARRRTVRVTAALVLAGTGVSGAELNRLTAGVEERVAKKLADLPPGAAIRMAVLTAAALTDPLIADAELTLADPDGAPGTPISLAPGEVLDVVRPFTFPTPQPERTVTGVVATTADVDLVLPIQLQTGVALADATAAAQLAVDAYLAAAGPLNPLTLAGLASSLQATTMFGLVREQASIVVEASGQFVQLLDGQGSFTPAAGQTLRRRTLDVREVAG
ncbi:MULTISPECIES: baseplate J/gp47 family protein [unclassified Mycobacterium]|uniref:baseplate J/gp47 family protein n=1 Tax=unclassified Mycobacterium TaxID=2642494 RepID=UPI0029C69507|nr:MULTISPECIES: baseplate J/gp47 family protein [unclassified Mycobacterium]